MGSCIVVPAERPLSPLVVRAHEIKNQLSVILAIGRLLEKDLPSRERTRLQRLIEATMRVSEIVDTSLAQAASSNEAFATVSFHRVAELVRERIEDRAADSRVELRLEVADGGLDANTDDLVEALGNLVSNAIKASCAGSVVTMTAAPSGADVVWTVDDAGRGMCPVQVARFGSPFRSTFEGGAGVGVAFAREVVERHRGSMTVDSEMGRGTRVTVRLPAVTR